MSAAGRNRAVVLVSGGIDSCVTAALARNSYRSAFLHCRYGQRTAERELRAFHAIADHFQVDDRLVTNLEHFRRFGGSSLTDRNREVPAGDLSRGGIPDTYVPFRNAGLLAAACAWAEVLGARRVFIGAVEEDSSGYPDCRREFFEAFNRAVELGTRPGSGLRVETPLIAMRKSEIVRTGLRLGAPLHLTWSCYEASGPACGRCDSCLMRLRAFREAGTTDPIAYAGRGEGDP